MAQGVFTRSTKMRLDELEAEENKLKQSIREEVAKQPTVTKEMILFVLRRFRDLDMRVQKNRERLIDGLIKAIIVYDDRFEVYLTYYDEAITIPTIEEIDEMKASSPVNTVPSPKIPSTNRCWGFLPPEIRRIKCGTRGANFSL